MELWIIIIIVVCVFSSAFIVVKLTYNRAFNNGFRYGYENNPIKNNNSDVIKDSIRLLKSITLYKNNKIVVKKVIANLEEIEDVSNLNEETLVNNLAKKG